MMKLLLGLFLLSTATHAGTLCEVYGISDSPQHLGCTFKGKPLELTCREGTYYVNETAVDSAFHYEVEDGPVPLVFKTASNELVVTLGEGKNHPATMKSGRKIIRGKCHL